jgi:hypothetical protein
VKVRHASFHYPNRFPSYQRHFWILLIATWRPKNTWGHIYIYLYSEFITRAKENGIWVQYLHSTCFWLQTGGFHIFGAYILFIVLQRILFSIVADFGMIYWKGGGHGRNWEYSVPNFVHPTFLSFLKPAQNLISFKNTLINMEALPLVSISKSMSLTNLTF